MKQQGIATSLLVLIVALVIAVGVGGYWYLRPLDDMSAGSESAPDSSVAIKEPHSSDISDASFSGGYFDAMDKGTPLSCSFRLPKEASDFQVGDGKFYTDGVNRGYSTGQFNIDGSTITAQAIFTADIIYSWTQLPGGQSVGFKTDLREAQAEFDSLSDTQRNDAYDYRAQYDFDCQSWVVDESFFEPPNDVDFNAIPSDGDSL